MHPLSLLGQILGLIAMAFIILSFQFKNPKRLFILQVCSCSLFILHYLLLGLGGDAAAYAGMAQNVVGLLLRILLTLSDKHKTLLSPMVMAGLCAIAAIVAVLTYPGQLIALLPVIGNYACIGGMWSKNSNTIRVVQLSVISPCWLLYNVVTLSIAGILTESFNILSIGVYYLRLYRQNRKA